MPTATEGESPHSLNIKDYRDEHNDSFGRVAQPSLRGATHHMMVGFADFVG